MDAETWCGLEVRLNQTPFPSETQIISIRKTSHFHPATCHLHPQHNPLPSATQSFSSTPQSSPAKPPQFTFSSSSRSSLSTMQRHQHRHGFGLHTNAFITRPPCLHNLLCDPRSVANPVTGPPRRVQVLYYSWQSVNTVFQ